jgi:uncharacterized NAD(P)/FAD-binding protein YdhS
MNLKTFCENSIEELRIFDAEKFVRLREDLHNKFFKGLIFSTTHGADIFKNILETLEGNPWKEEGEYGANFKKGIKQWQKS